MSQITVVELLKKEYPKWFTVREIADKLDVVRNSISTNVRRLRKGTAIKWRTRKSMQPSRRPSLEYQYQK